MRYLKRFWWILIVILLVGGGFWRWKSAQAKELATKTYTVKREDLTETLSLSGQVDALEKAEIKFQTSGLLTWVGVKEGDKVKKYQAIASLDKRELQNTMTQYLNSYTKARNEFEQAQSDNKDWETNGMTDAAREAIKRTLSTEQMALNNSVLAFEAKNLALKFATIFAPFPGIITKVDVPVPGTNITPTSAVFDIVNPETLYLSTTADQTEVPSITEGMTGKVIMDSFPDKELTGTVKAIGFVPKTSEAGTVYEIKIIFDTTELGSVLKMGMTGDINFTLKEIKNVLAIPEAYIKKEDGKYYVTKMISGQLKKSEVTQGDTVEGMVEIKEGLNENDVIYNQP